MHVLPFLSRNKIGELNQPLWAINNKKNISNVLEKNMFVLKIKKMY